MVRRFYFFSLLILTMLCASPQALAGETNGLAARLPATVVPSRYQILLDPRPDEGKFSGSETIDIKVGAPTNAIILNAANLDLSDASCVAADGRHLRLKIHCKPDAEQVSLTCSSSMAAGSYQLSLSFHGKLNDRVEGFFRSAVTEANGHKRWVVATQMEPTDARRVFPCFDEPQFKATFKISASVAADAVAISNAPVSAESSIDAKTKRKVVTFSETPKMSTYLVALVVGNLVATEPTIVDGVPIRIWSTPEKHKLAPFSQQLAVKLLPFYRQYFNVAYPAKKLDLIAVPDFSYGAMENLGAIIFRETDLLVDEKTGSIDAKENVSINVAHEMAHMWFGDLVTMQWWNDIWLNEAFAEWMSTKAINHLCPQWHYWNEFASKRQQAMLSDSLSATRSIHFEVKKTDEIEQMFDEITYYKGASVLRMLESYVGEDAFRDGVRRYIKSHEFANATTDDLWRCIASESGKNVPELMRSWIFQEGFPLVKVNASGSQTQISQERFLLKEGKSIASAAVAPTSSSASKMRPAMTLAEQGKSWTIPLAVRNLDHGGVDQTYLLGDRQIVLSGANAPYLVNASGEGFYRVLYNSQALNEIVEHLPELTPLERCALLSDQFNLALSGRTSVKQYLDFTAKFKTEDDPFVIAELCSEFEQLDLLVDDSSRSAFAAYVRDTLGHAKRALGWTNQASDSDLTKRERAQVMTMMGTVGDDEETIDEACMLFKKYLAKRDAIDPQMIEPTIDIVAYNGNESDYENIELAWRRAELPEVKRTCLMALAMFRQPELLQRTLKMSLSHQVAREDGPALIAQVMDQASGRDIAWHFMRKHLIRIAWRFSVHNMREIVIAMNSLDTKQQLAEVEEFFKAHPAPSESRSINKIIEAIQIRVAFRQRSGNELSTRLSTIAHPLASRETGVLKR